MRFDEEIDKLTNLPPHIRERLKQEHASRQAAEDERIEKYRQRFQFSDSAMGAYRGPNGQINPDSVFVIRKWQNGYGDTVYTKTAPNEKDPAGDELKIYLYELKTSRESLPIRSGRTNKSPFRFFSRKDRFQIWSIPFQRSS